MEKAEELLRLLEEEKEYRETNRLKFYAPYEKQRGFHRDGLNFRERLFLAGNQLGKTLAGGMELAMHLTGEYPDWWDGKVFSKPVRWWAAGVSSESTRDNPQRILLGPIGAVGTGTIPRRRIKEIRQSRGVSDAVDTVLVKHKKGTSQVSFKSYEKGREKWQGETLDGVWFDEEPPVDIYTEGLTRTNATKGLAFITATPLLGMSDVVSRFVNPLAGDVPKSLTTMTISDVGHYSEEEKQAIINAYPLHEREARANGVPLLGSGRVFPVPEEMVRIPSFPIPDHWPRLVGMDFGWDHPTAAVWIAWDRDTDTIYVYDTYRQREVVTAVHADAIRSRGDWIPVAWPHDGLQHDKGAGEQLAEQYRQKGLNMNFERAQYPDDRGNAVEAGVMDMLDRMASGRLKVFDHLTDWFDEFRMYHRKDGKIVKERDDLMASTRIAVMDLRYAATGVSWKKFTGKIKYPSLGIA